MIEVTLDIQQADRFFRRLEAWPDRSVMSAIGQLAVLASRRRIRSTKTDLKGRDWKPWSTSTRKKHGAHTLLKDSGAMLNTIKLLGASNEEALVAAAVPYSGFQHEGTRTIPAREFLGLGDEDEKAVAVIFEDQLEQLIQEVAA